MTDLAALFLNSIEIDDIVNPILPGLLNTLQTGRAY